MFEAAKGALVVAAGLGLLSLLHHDLQAVAERLVQHSHLNPAHHYPQIFIEAAGRMNDARLVGLAVLAFLYSALRFVEAYGLWHMRTWAEWLAIVAGSAYVPIEVYEIWQRPTWLRGFVLLTNVLIVVYLVKVRVAGRHRLDEPASR